MGIFDFRKPNTEKLHKKGDVKGLLKALKHPDPYIRTNAVEALGKIGKPALPVLIDFQGDESIDVKIREEIPCILGKILGRKVEELGFFEGLPPTGDGLCSDRECPCLEVRIPRGTGYAYVSEELVKDRYNARSLDKLQENIKKLLKGLNASAIVSSSLSSPLLMCELGAALRGIDLELAAEDAKLWWETKLVPLRPTPRSARSARVEPLMRILIKAVREYRSAEVRKKARETLVRIGKPVVEPLLEVLNDRDSIIRQLVAEVLGRIGDNRSVEALTEMMRTDENNNIRKAAKEALEKITKKMSNET